MRVLVLGGGGREHALVWKLRQSPRVTDLFACPGNAGIAQMAETVQLSLDDPNALAQFAIENRIDLTFAGPEAPLVAGVGDMFGARLLHLFGPGKAQARLEGSKVYAKKLMRELGIPTAEFEVFADATKAIEYARAANRPLVVKADGLAAGKGVIVCDGPAEAEDAIRQIMVDQAFGAAGKEIVIEERLEGEEATLMFFLDGRTSAPMLPSQDHKRRDEGDAGPNTGGMGCYAPVPAVPEALVAEVQQGVVAPILEALDLRGIPYKGVLYVGLMLTREGYRVLEFNVRFGDPEAQTVLPLLESDLVDVATTVIDGGLYRLKPRWSSQKALTVVLASGGYPGSYETGKVIEGLEDAAKVPGVVVFHAGTAERDGQIVTAGGRVLNVTAVGETHAEAAKRAYEAVSKIHFEGMYYRRDIGWRVISKEQA
ncbi:MAG TPA: phosphoribosylamine--glycine ligase [Armatimonadota bacterium]|nr:phosphoribosylamine--glycine ligase [Armatimonadota bacterium]HOJ21034.1 phosphoribosylamine--glycine ligase [Armatimonadota bacterium]HOM80942.1 phosphoribosylamine--glycine ligase [Armatimonadota bacterium]HPO72747.1 phosphoribosylamine--glycine ligase [Armatimonadota bacterium]